MKRRLIEMLSVAVLVLGAVFAGNVGSAHAEELEPLCAGDGSARVEFLYGLHSGVGTTIFTNGSPSVSYPGHAIGFQILSTNPSRYNFEWVVSTDAAQANVIDSTRLAGFTFHPEGSSQEGFSRWEWNGGFAPRNFDTDYFFSVNLYLPDGTEFACSPVLRMPGISQTAAEAFANDGGGMPSWSAYLGSNPYAPGGLFDTRPAAPQANEVSLDPSQVIEVPAEFGSFAEIMNVEFSTDGGETWATADLESVTQSPTLNTQTSLNTSSPTISTALYRTSSHASFQAAASSSSLDATFGIATQSNGAPLANGANYEISLRGVNQTSGGSNLFGAKSADICYQMGDPTGSLCTDTGSNANLADTGASQAQLIAAMGALSAVGALIVGLVVHTKVRRRREARVLTSSSN